MYNNYEKVGRWLRGGKMKRYDMISKKRTDYRVKHVKDILDLLYPELEKTLSECSVLDIGSGRGHLSAVIANYVKYLKGIDNNEKAVKEARKKIAKHNIKNVDFEVMSFYDFDEKENYDVVIFSDVLEHVINKEGALKIVANALKKGGVFYISTNNKLWIMEGHYFLPFLSFLPKGLANRYVGFFRKGKDYNSCYLPTYFQLKRLLDALPITYTFKPPKNHERLMYRFGTFLVNTSGFFWIFANAFQVIGKKDS